MSAIVKNCKIYAESTKNYCYRNHKQSSKARGYEPLDRVVWENLVKKECFYCGDMGEVRFIKIPNDTEENIQKTRIKINGIDRLDSGKGYNIENCVPCCRACNRMKSDYLLNDFFKRIEKIAKNLNL